MSDSTTCAHFYGDARSRGEFSRIRTEMEREVGGFYLLETSYPAGLMLPSHAHERAVFSLLLQGTFTVTDKKKSRQCKPASFVYIPPGEEHSNHFDNAGGRCFIMGIAPRWMERINEYSAIPDERVEFPGGALSWLSLRLHEEARQLDEVSHLAIEGLALEIMAEISRQRKNFAERKPPPWLNQAIELLRERFAENLTLNNIAGTVGVHPVYLANAFRRHQGCTVGEYIRRLRIEFACEQITASDDPLVGIALASGFSDQSHFSKAFKRLIGMTPAQYRAAFRSP